MHYYEVAPNQIARAGDGFFTYHSELDLNPGHIVEIPLGSKSAIGIVLRSTHKPSYKTKPVTSLVDEAALPRPLLKLTLWLSSYYATPLASAIQTVLPRGVNKTRRVRTSKPSIAVNRTRTNFVLNSEQSAAVEAITSSATGSLILHGRTGSGKTAVYINVAKRMISDGKSVVLLVPEIALTSQIVAEFSHHFDDVILTHSRQTEAERHLAWKEALTSTKPRVVIGPRSALFLPLQSIGAIIIDEAHEPSFKQEKSPRYSALRAASVLGEYHSAKVVFGSATPSVADYYLANDSNSIVRLTRSARTNTTEPDVKLIDMTKRTNFKKHRFLSDNLLDEIARSLAKDEQVLIFHNRRGSASSTLCENCGWIAGCPQCFVPLTLHADKHNLRCHVCGYTDRVPTSCPECNEVDIIHKGIGTKLIESELRKLFPKAEIARFDGDSKDSENVESRYSDIYSGKIQIVIGTQVVAKGLDLPKLRTVGVIQADAGLSLPDFSSSERTFQLLAQVIGRVGRSEHSTNVIVQSYQPSHPSIVTGLSQDYQSFYSFALAERKRSNFPPYSYLLKMTCIYKTEAASIRNSKKLAQELKAKLPELEILGPTPAFYERAGDTYRWQIVVKSRRRADLLKALALLPSANWQYELDPVSLL